MQPKTVRSIVLGLAIAFIVLVISKEASATVMWGTVKGTQMQQQGLDNSVVTSPTQNLQFQDRLQIPPTPSAIAPSVVNVQTCPVGTQKTSAFSMFLLSVSNAGSLEYNDICYALHREQFDIADKLMCKRSKDYAELNPSCSK